MILVQRNAAQQITAVQYCKDADRDRYDSTWQNVDADNPDLITFLAGLEPPSVPNSVPTGALGHTDLPMTRVLEDLIDILVDRSLIRFTDFPSAAQTKLIERREARHALRQLDLLSNDHNHDNETL